MKGKLIRVVEQDAIYDGEPDFLPLAAAINLINHESYGGTSVDFEQAKITGDLQNPKRYRVRLALYVEEL